MAEQSIRGAPSGAALSAAQRAYVRRETLVSVATNSVLSLVFAALLSAGRASIPLWGPGGMALDFIPQVFMVILATTLAVTLLTRKRLRAGAVDPLGKLQAGWLARAPRPAVVRAVLFGLAGAIVLAPLSAAVLAVADVSSLSAPVFMSFKVAYGAVLTLVSAPFIVRAALAGD